MAEVPRYRRVISADSHVFEPLDIWWNAIGHKYGDRTPRIIDEYQGQKGQFFWNGYPGWQVRLLGRSPTVETEPQVKEAYDKGYEACGYDPEVRVRFQLEAGIEAETMLSSQLTRILLNPDVEIVQACAQVYNDWKTELCSYSPKRLLGVSAIPMNDADWAVKELEKTLKNGLMPLINCQAPNGAPPYRNRVYDKFWAAAEEANVAITLHLLTGRVFDPLAGYADSLTPEERGGLPHMWIDLFNEIQTVLADDFIFGGILDRFPKLRGVCSEFEMSWVPGFMARLDQMEEIAPTLFLPKLQMKASDYMRSRIWHGFVDDTVAAHAIPYVGASQVLWGSDFPHIRAIGLDPHSSVFELIQTLPPEDQEMIVGGNAAKVWPRHLI